MKTTRPITYRYEVDGKVVGITRIHTGTAYARNGNVGNPTEYFVWDARVDGRFVGQFDTRANAYEAATGHKYCTVDGRTHGTGKPVRSWTTVRDEMQANYRGRVKT